MNVVTLILPKDISILEKKYTEVVADIIAKKLTSEELEYFISEFDKRQTKESIS